MKFIAAACLALLTTTAQAQSPDCSLSPPGWQINTPLVAVTEPAALENAQLILGKASHVTLHSAAKVRYVTSPERTPDPTLHGGLVSVMIPAPSNYRVGLSSGAWIDVLQDGKPVTSTAHGHGEGCVRKAVTFPLKAGRTVIQISGNREADLRLMAWRQD
jgi:hypothetical protein